MNIFSLNDWDNASDICHQPENSNNKIWKLHYFECLWVRGMSHNYSTESPFHERSIGSSDGKNDIGKLCVYLREHFEILLDVGVPYIGLYMYLYVDVREGYVFQVFFNGIHPCLRGDCVLAYVQDRIKRSCISNMYMFGHIYWRRVMQQQHYSCDPLRVSYPRMHHVINVRSAYETAINVYACANQYFLACMQFSQI